jgi:hypothetical protein
MRPFRLAPLLLLLFLSACQSVYQGVIILDGEQRFDRPIEGDLLMLKGSVELGPKADLTGSAYVLGGLLRIAGRVEGDVLVFDGRLEMAAGSQVGGDVRMGSGAIERAPDAQVGGSLTEGLPLPLPESMLGGSPSLSERFPSMIRQAILFAVLGLILQKFLPRPVERIERAVRQYPLMSGAVGILSGIVSLVLLVQMAFTVVLLPVTMFGMLLLFCAGAYGLIALGVRWGREIGTRIEPRAPLPLLAALGSAGVSLLLDLLNLLPYAGGALSALMLATGFGAVLLTRFGWVSYQPVRDRQLL